MKSVLFTTSMLAGLVLAGCATAPKPGELDYGRTSVTPVQAQDSYYLDGDRRVE